MIIKKILIFVETAEGQINPVCYELLTKTQQLFSGEEIRTAFAVFGSGLAEHLLDLKQAGVDEIFALDDARLKVFNIDYYCAALSAAVKAYEPELLLIGATMLGEELAPTMGLKLNTGVAAHCMDIRKGTNGELAHLVPAFGGKVIGEIYIPNTKPQISSIKPGIFKAEQMASRNAVISNLDLKVLDQTKTGIYVLHVHKKATSGMPLDKAEVVVCGGYGIGDKENWTNMEQLSDYLNGAVGCTRPAVDCGFATDEGNMIGTSGKSIRPKVYLGFGISGATHHLCGIKDSGLIITVNSDDNAEIFKSSDYYAVGDAGEIINKLNGLLKQK
jgi:electron transfer flavoprotein alpha subunit